MVFAEQTFLPERRRPFTLGLSSRPWLYASGKHRERRKRGNNVFGATQQSKEWKTGRNRGKTGAPEPCPAPTRKRDVFLLGVVSFVLSELVCPWGFWHAPCFAFPAALSVARSEFTPVSYKPINRPDRPEGIHCSPAKPRDRVPCCESVISQLGTQWRDCTLFPAAAGPGELAPLFLAAHGEKGDRLTKNDRFVLIWQKEESSLRAAVPAPGYLIPKPPAWIRAQRVYALRCLPGRPQRTGPRANGCDKQKGKKR